MPAGRQPTHPHSPCCHPLASCRHSTPCPQTRQWNIATKNTKSHKTESRGIPFFHMRLCPFVAIVSIHSPHNHREGKTLSPDGLRRSSRNNADPARWRKGISRDLLGRGSVLFIAQCKIDYFSILKVNYEHRHDEFIRRTD